MRPDLVALKQRRQKIFRMKIKLSRKRKSPDWTISDIDKALSDLKIISQEILRAISMRYLNMG
jgi:hypothetical protein